jgi:DNA polymerase-4
MLIRLVGVRLSGLIRGVQQLNLFEDTSEMVHLYLALDKLRRRYGSDSVKRASGIQLQDLEERIEQSQQQSSISSPEDRRQIDNLKNRRFRYWYR